ncbi:NAC domain-containing protein [Melia azedarach]|uniref:NAC domain-containing protein n=1 Tax=Melia azedarach TaxID=155640 RepID=A0ACC1X585_MELAZ|nr:NAC domain-containing protein [Melia azedarach]
MYQHQQSTMQATLPPGCKIIFDPTDQQIILDYLLKKVLGNLPPSDWVIEWNIYGDSEVWKNFFEERRENTLYFFTKLKKKSERGSRFDRVTECGTWKSQKDTKIYSLSCDHQRKHIGSRRNFTFVWKKGRDKNKGVRWIMHEYRLDGCLLLNKETNNNCRDDYVLCRIKRKGKIKEDDEEEVMASCSSSDIIMRGFQGNIMSTVELSDSVWNTAERFHNMVSAEVANVGVNGEGLLYSEEIDHSNLCLSLKDLEDDYYKVDDQLQLPGVQVGRPVNIVEVQPLNIMEVQLDTTPDWNTSQDLEKILSDSTVENLDYDFGRTQDELQDVAARKPNFSRTVC